ncbi:hypothetical protein NFI96_000128 [Prochilodus magdalenae]|nr:hypothetical protein NFI96_000128 [Prochilodus magdalenae]
MILHPRLVSGAYTVYCFGMTTPVTVAGKVFLIFYGLLGCAATILFFNLFLERIITLLAVVMKAFRLRRLRTSGLLPPGICQDFAASSLPGWKPSVYHVMLILGLSAIVISCCASAMYTPVEGWAYLDSLYFCFVTFSTIGFGDLVSSQSEAYGYQGLYRLANFLFILTGVCCIYSLFNVISIVIKQVLNWMLGKMSCLCCQRCNKANAFLGRRNAIRPGSRLRQGRFGRPPDAEGSDTEGRRLSGEMISMRDLTGSNKISLAIMQKQLSESANGYPRTVCGSSRHNGFSGGVGALGIMNNRLAETSDTSVPPSELQVKPKVKISRSRGILGAFKEDQSYRSLYNGLGVRSSGLWSCLFTFGSLKHTRITHLLLHKSEALGNLPRSQSTGRSSNQLPSFKERDNTKIRRRGAPQEEG